MFIVLRGTTLNQQWFANTNLKAMVMKQVKTAKDILLIVVIFCRWRCKKSRQIEQITSINDIIWFPWNVSTFLCIVICVSITYQQRESSSIHAVFLIQSTRKKEDKRHISFFRWRANTGCLSRIVVFRYRLNQRSWLDGVNCEFMGTVPPLDNFRRLKKYVV